jgi:undecaprenyl-diphosphatase
MSFIYALILGVVEGLTEFLPVSSTAHLILTSAFLKIPQTDFQKLFEVVIQSGAILAVLFLYFNYLLKNKNLWGKLVASFLPTAVVGFLFYKIIKSVFFESINLIIFSLFFIGLIFLLIEFLIKQKKIKLEKGLSSLTYSNAVLIGLAQSLAIVPGISRAGIVMIAMLIMGYRREESAIYSFLLALPTIIAASLLDLYKGRALLAQANLVYIAIGFFVALLTAIIAVRWFVNFLKNHTLVVFGWYRIILALFLLIALRLAII